MKVNRGFVFPRGNLKVIGRTVADIDSEPLADGRLENRDLRGGIDDRVHSA